MKRTPANLAVNLTDFALNVCIQFIALLVSFSQNLGKEGEGEEEKDDEKGEVKFKFNLVGSI